MWLPDLSRYSGPRYVALAEAIAHAVRSGELAPGTRLPPQRLLARQLGLNLTTVSRGFALADEMGLVSGEVGRGTYVRVLPDPGRVPWPPVREAQQIDLSSNFPFPAATGAHLGRALEGVTRGDLATSLLRYEPRGAHPAHQEAARNWLRQFHLQVPAERLLLTSGAIHAVFVCLLALARAGDRVLAEELTYPALIGACNVLGLRAEGVAMDAEGIRPDALEVALGRERAKAIVLVPNLQNPTSATMPLPRREAIVAIARRHGVMIIEDDAYGPLLDLPERLPPLAALAPERVCFATSLSKAVAPGLRVGFLAVPAALHAPAVSAARVSTWMTSPLLAHVAAQWIADGTASDLAARQRAITARRQQIASEILKDCDFRRGSRAHHIWLKLPEPWRAEELTAHLLSHGVSVLPSSAMAVDPGVRPAAVRISLCNVAREDDLRTGLEVVARALRGLD